MSGSLWALGAVLGAMALSGAKGSACTSCGGSLARKGPHDDPDEFERIGESMKMRRLQIPALWLVPLPHAKNIGKTWSAYRKLRLQELSENPSLLNGRSIAYGQMKAARKKDKALAIRKAVEVQVKTDFAETSLDGIPICPKPAGRMTPFGKHGMYDYLLNHTVLELTYPTGSDASLHREGIGAATAPLSIGEPRIYIYERTQSGEKGQRLAIYGVARDVNALLWPSGCDSINLFTSTSKMSSPSFSLPAGVKQVGGTCAGAALKSEPGREADNICTMCYALKAHYGYLSNITPSMVRLAWVEQMLRTDKTGQSLGRMFAAAIESYARFSKINGWADRSEQELGVLHKTSGRENVLVGPYVGKSRKLEYRSIATTVLGPMTLGQVERAKVKDRSGRVISRREKSTAELFARMDAKKGSVAGFFRIHDSGDFSVPHAQGYVAAWGAAAALLPHVYFWAPTRLWKSDGTRRMLVTLALNANMAIRPSAIHVGDPAPDVTGLAAGSAVNVWLPKEKDHAPAVSESGVKAYQCPVYSLTIVDPKTGKYKEAKSCHEARCRLCWLAKPTPIAYGKH